jgi:carbon storage regulator
MVIPLCRPGESIVLNGDITITAVEVRGDRVLLGVVAPEHVPVQRGEELELGAI